MAEGRTIWVLNGPNLNLLGQREPEIYGYDTLEDIAERMEDVGSRAHVEMEFRQSNHEGELIDWLHEANATGAHAVILNPGGLTHTSVALLDAIKAIKVPVIEVHLSNPHAREEFRHTSWVGMAAKATVAGFGAGGYLLALEGAAAL
jgi:3-dehydroquinate dehydratase-2